MRPLSIAVGNSRHTTLWKNKTISFEDLKGRLSTPLKTSESSSDYAKMQKSQRDDTKDHGGFVCGALKDGKRKISHVESRSILSFDADYITAEFLDSFSSSFQYGAVLYSTHSSTPENPRVRILCPLKRDVTPDEFVAVSRYVADSIGIDYFDECSYRTNQIMYWPTISYDGVFVYKEVDKPWLDPDEILSAHPDWTDPEKLPISSREKKNHSREQKKVQDPLTKDGVVGLFNRAYYPITLALEEFLSDEYESTGSDTRWHYIPSHSVAGVEIIEDKFVYSHHAKDPAYLQLCNAFDIVRIHKFGDMDEKESFRSMSEFAMENEKVRLLSLEEKREQAQVEFAQEDDWKTQLRYMKRSKCLENCVWNLMLILQNDPDYRNFALNEFVGRIQITGKVPWERPEGNSFWRDADTAQLKALIDINYETFSSRNHDVAFTKVVEDRHFHPLRDKLEALPKWDGVKRLETLFIDYLGAKDTAYVRAATRKPFVAAVARVYNPGIKFDTITVLVGPQGCGKSTIIARMGEEYYSDSLNLFDMKDKAGAEKLQGYWILELGELAGMKKADIELVKAFASRTDDIYRPSYGRTVESHPRQCVILGTTNSESGFLRDITGNRRFWPINVTGVSRKKPWDITRDEVKLLWAEAKYLYESGEPLFLSAEEDDEAVAEQVDAMESDERQGLVEEYLEKLLPDNWDSLDLYERRNYLSDSLSPKGTVKRQIVSNPEIWCECFGRNLSELSRHDSDSIVAIMTKVKGWGKTGKSKRLNIYGKQKIYERQFQPEMEPVWNQDDDIPF